jgi:hypothetical protein
MVPQGQGAAVDLRRDIFFPLWPGQKRTRLLSKQRYNAAKTAMAKDFIILFINGMPDFGPIFLHFLLMQPKQLSRIWISANAQCVLKKNPEINLPLSGSNRKKSVFRRPLPLPYEFRYVL